jgi:hypothetical protein
VSGAGWTREGEKRSIHCENNSTFRFWANNPSRSRSSSNILPETAKSCFEMVERESVRLRD